MTLTRSQVLHAFKCHGALGGAKQTGWVSVPGCWSCAMLVDTKGNVYALDVFGENEAFLRTPKGWRELN